MSAPFAKRSPCRDCGAKTVRSPRFFAAFLSEALADAYALAPPGSDAGGHAAAFVVISTAVELAVPELEGCCVLCGEKMRKALAAARARKAGGAS
jgi:hypothetical protein